MYIINVESGQLTRVPPAPQSAGAGARTGRPRRRGGGGPGGGSSMVFARDGRTLYFRSGTGLFAAPINLHGRRRRGGSGGRGGAAADAVAAAARRRPNRPANATARQVTYTVNIEVDRKALRAQVFNEGWRIMKNRFYDAKMHGADWNAAKAAYEPLLDYLVDDEELHTVMMMMIGQLNASHTGVSGGGRPNDDRPALQTRHPGFDLAADASGFYKVGHIYKDGPADRDYLKIKKGDFLIAVDDHDLKTSENYWQYFTLAAGSKFHFLVNDKPAKEGAWAVTISPVAGGAFGDLQYARWVDDRREMVTKLSNGDIGYLHIRAMDAPSLRQFQLDLAAKRTKKALVIDQRFNGGGGIDQELLGHPRRAPVSVHDRPRRRLPAAAAAELLRPDGRDAERALGVGRRDVPRRLQGARPRQGHRRADDGRGHRNGLVHAARRRRRSARRAAASGPSPARTWRTTACRPTCTSTTRPATSSRDATRRSRRRSRC